MAYPISGNYETRTPGTTIIKAAWGDTVDANITGIIGGSKSIKSLWVDGVGNAASIVGSGAARIANGLLIDSVGLVITAGGMLITAGSATLSSGDLSVSGKGTFLQVRSSATKGAGQAVAAGEVWKDTTVFAWFVATVSATVLTFVRGANIANVVRDAKGQFTVTMQTAATNVLVPMVSMGTTPAAFTYIDFNAGAPTTTIFHFACYEPSVSDFLDPASIYCVIYQG